MESKFWCLQLVGSLVKYEIMLFSALVGIATFGTLLMVAITQKKLTIFSFVFILCALLDYVFVRQLHKIALGKLEIIVFVLTSQKRPL